MIDRCLTSVREQTYPRVEHIVVDGASTDRTVALLEKETGIQWVTEPDEGQADALNKGLARAKGEILGWLNADDILIPSAIESVVSRLRADPHTHWVTGRAIVRRQGSCQIEPRLEPRDPDLDFGNPIVQPSTFFAREALTRAGQIDPHLHFAMDLDLWLRFVELGLQRAFLSEILSDVVYASDSKTGGLDPVFFFKEEVLVYTKHQRPIAAILALGRVAAYSSIKRGRITRSSLAKATADAADWAAAHDVRFPLHELAAVARVEASFAEMHQHRGLWPLRHLLGSQPWMSRPGRRRLLHGIQRKLLARRS